VFRGAVCGWLATFQVIPVICRTDGYRQTATLFANPPSWVGTSLGRGLVVACVDGYLQWTLLSVCMCLLHEHQLAAVSLCRPWPGMTHTALIVDL
jgi:hypothetical protein